MTLTTWMRYLYGNIVMWKLPAATVRAARSWAAHPNFIRALGTRRNVDELLYHLRRYSSVRFTAMPSIWRAHNETQYDDSVLPGYKGEGAHFVLYDPWRGLVLRSRKESYKRMHDRRCIPLGHPRRCTGRSERSASEEDERTFPVGSEYALGAGVCHIDAGDPWTGMSTHALLPYASASSFCAGST